MLFFTQRLRDSITPTARTWTPRTITWRLWAAIILIPVFMLSLGLFAFHGTSRLAGSLRPNCFTTTTPTTTGHSPTPMMPETV